MSILALAMVSLMGLNLYAAEDEIKIETTKEEETKEESSEANEASDTTTTAENAAEETKPIA